MINLSLKNTFSVLLLSATIPVIITCSQAVSQILETIADARSHPARLIDNGEPGDSVGDVLVFDQPLLDKDMNKIGSNSGICIRTRVAHSFQCQWTLTMENGTIQVAGREQDQGTSTISIIGGTGRYSGITGEMQSTNNNDGTFSQVLSYTLP